MLINYTSKITALLVFIFIIPTFVQAIESNISITSLARKVVENYLSHKTFDVKKYSLNKVNNTKLLGVFVTIYNSNNKTRGCWGYLYPNGNLMKSVEMAAIGAIKNDYRQRPISFNELKDLKFQVTIIKDIVNVSSFQEVSPVSNGMMVQSGTKTGIILPGEAVDSYYQMVMCKLKAGISDKENYKIYKLITTTYRE